MTVLAGADVPYRQHVDIRSVDDVPDAETVMHHAIIVQAETRRRTPATPAAWRMRSTCGTFWRARTAS